MLTIDFHGRKLRLGKHMLAALEPLLISTPRSVTHRG
jgi:hypothetical protein